MPLTQEQLKQKLSTFRFARTKVDYLQRILKKRAWLSENSRKLVQRAVEKHLPTAVQEQLERGHLRDALESLGNAGKYKEAAALALQRGDTHQAYEFFAKAGKFRKAAEVAQSIGADYAVRYFYEKAGDYLNAARWALRDEHPVTGTDFEGVVKLFEKANAHLEGALSLATFNRQDLVDRLLRNAPSEQRMAVQAVQQGKFVHAAKLLDRLGEYSLAAALALKGKDYKLASQSFDKAGQHVEGALELAEWRQKELADALLAKKKAFFVAAKKALDKGHGEIAVEWFVESGKPFQGAMVALKMKAPYQAADLFRLARHHAKGAHELLSRGHELIAADLYAEAGMHSKAAALYDKLGRSKEALAAYKRARQA